MSPDLIIAIVLFGPGIAALAATARLWHRAQQDDAAERMVFQQQYATLPPVPAHRPVPPTPGFPLPAPVAAPARPALAPVTGEGLAPVVDLATRRRAA